MVWSGFANKASKEAACEEMGVSRARFLRGRLERGSEEVGIDSGIGSDILIICLELSYLRYVLGEGFLWREGVWIVVVCRLGVGFGRKAVNFALRWEELRYFVRRASITN